MSTKREVLSYVTKQPNMKQAVLTLFTLVLIQMSYGQESETQLGDNFSLENTLELFRSSSSLEDFEKAINAKDNSANNLDLNHDGNIDFLIIRDEVGDDAHAIVISAIISDQETQDVAVIEIEKTGNQEAMLQIIGDEALYEEGAIVEPYEEHTALKGSGPYSPDLYPRLTVNVWFWPSVSYIYRPNYITYRSTWRWGNYPRWWTPWRPLTWSVWRPLRVRHASRYRVTRIHRVTAAHKVYVPKRRVSNTVTVRKTTRVRSSNGVAINTRTTKVVKNKNGNKKASKTVNKRVAKTSNRKATKTTVLKKKSTN